MAYLEIEVDGIGKVRIFRRRGLKNLRVTLAHDGTVRLSLPWYVAKSTGLRFLHSKADWIKAHKPKISAGWHDGQKLAGSYKLKITKADKKRSSSFARAGVFEVFIPKNIEDSHISETVNRHVAVFLKEQCELTLVPLLENLAIKHGFKVKSIAVKKLRSRWGSCSQKKVITLNSSLVNLPSALARYVIFHELAHTKHLNHGKDFWSEVEKVVPDYREQRKLLRRYNPAGFFSDT